MSERSDKGNKFINSVLWSNALSKTRKKMTSNDILYGCKMWHVDERTIQRLLTKRWISGEDQFRIMHITKVSVQQFMECAKRMVGDTQQLQLRRYDHIQILRREEEYLNDRKAWSVSTGIRRRLYKRVIQTETLDRPLICRRLLLSVGNW